MPNVIAAGLSHPGKVRKRNEDAFYLFDGLTADSSGALCSDAARADATLQFYAIADGMGGKGVGDTAALAALKALDTARRQIRQPDRFDFPFFARHFLNRAGQAVLESLGDSRGLYTGTAFTLLCLTDDHAYVLALGNCRCYRLRDGVLTRLMEDDILPDSTPRRLSRYLGQLPEDGPDEPVQLYQDDLQSGDLFLLTTDGFTDEVSEADITRILSSPDAFALKPGAMMDLAMAGEARDNATLLIVKVLDTTGKEPIPEDNRRPVRHRRRAFKPITSPVIRGLLIFLVFVLTGFVAGWLLLTLLL